LEAVRSGRGADLILIDLQLDIRSLTHSLKAERISIPVVACGIAVSPEMAAAAIRAGAKEYIPLPPDPELIGAVITAIVKNDQEVIFKDPKMRQVYQLADRIAPTDANVLITGESGTGKEVMARYIHHKSKRAGRPFISVNCAAIPENLLESELFGHEKGAFTGAIARRIGKFEEANGGTLLLDEVTEMHPRLQAKLLRAIQERVIDRLGGSHSLPVNIRIIATSNRDIMQAVKEGIFREDLYFRLHVMNLHLPPLAQRPEDVMALTAYFITKYSELNQTAPKSLSPEVEKALKGHAWPGNVRELENTIHRAVLLSLSNTLEVQDLMLTPRTDGSNLSNTNDATTLIGRTVTEVERELILGTLDHCLGNRTHAATILGISLRTLRNKLREYMDEGIPVPSAAVRG
jgi:DNA-binding NtrC family response regulator